MCVRVFEPTMLITIVFEGKIGFLFVCSLFVPCWRRFSRQGGSQAGHLLLRSQRSFSIIKIFALGGQKKEEEKYNAEERGRFIWEIRAGNFLDVISQFPPNGVSQLFLVFVILD